MEDAGVPVQDSFLETFYPHYYNLRTVGHGTYGFVCSALDLRSRQRVAIKRIRLISPRLYLSVIREIELLRHFKHENIVSLIDVLKREEPGGESSIYLVQEFVSCNLERVLESRTDGLDNEHCEYFTYQILRGLKAIHTAGVWHRDLKPANILLNENCDLKICDFGLARVGPIQCDGPAHLTEYVVTRWYRAPEVLLTFKRYYDAIDIWSVGCILAEMLGRRPLFPGKTYTHQLELILDTLGTPCAEDFEAIGSKRSLKVLQSYHFRPPKPWSVHLPNACNGALDLLGELLHFNPAKRIRVVEALSHPYLAQWSDSNDEPVGRPIPKILHQIDRLDPNRDSWRLRHILFKKTPLVLSPIEKTRTNLSGSGGDEAEKTAYQMKV